MIFDLLEPKVHQGMISYSATRRTIVGLPQLCCRLDRRSGRVAGGPRMSNVARAAGQADENLTLLDSSIPVIPP